MATDRDATTMITDLTSRRRLEEVIRECSENTTDIGDLAASISRVEKVGIATAAALAAHMAQPKLTPKMLKAWGIAMSTVLAVIVGGLTQWRVAQAGVESRRGAEIAAAQAFDRKAEIDRQKLAVETAELAARRTGEEVRRAFREEQAEAERRASMRVAPARGTR